MTFRKVQPILIIIITLMFLCVVGHGEETSSSTQSPAIKYWNKMLPNTPIPQTIKDALYKPEWLLQDSKSTSVTVGKGGVGVATENPTGKGLTKVNVGHGAVGVETGLRGQTHTTVGVTHGGVGVSTSTGKPGQGRTSVGVGKGGVAVDTGNGGGHTSVGVGKGGVGVRTGNGETGSGTAVGVGKGGVAVHTRGKHGRHPVYVGVHPGPNPFIYNYAASKSQLHDDDDSTTTVAPLFFLQNDLKPGTKLNNLKFTRSNDGDGGNTAPFLSRSEADSIPFTSNEFSTILNRFSLTPDSIEAKSMKSTINECETTNNTDHPEVKSCATSLESMLDFVTSNLGDKKLTPLTTETTHSGITLPSVQQSYTIVNVRKMQQQENNNNNNNEMVACHKESYPYAVYYCHKAEKTVVYKVSMIGTNGVRVEAAAVCHQDTSGWNRKHVAFVVLNVKPGSVPVCHFLPKDHIVWVRN